MRDRNRIKPFMEELGKLWEEKVPDWRFGQLICNVMGSLDRDPWFLEEDEMMEKIKKFFDEDKGE